MSSEQYPGLAPLAAVQSGCDGVDKDLFSIAPHRPTWVKSDLHVISRVNDHEYGTSSSEEDSLDTTVPLCKGILVRQPVSRCSQAKAPSKPHKQVRISELRRCSITGSLPDLTKASDADVQESHALIQYNVGNDNTESSTPRLPVSPRLPAGSETFQLALSELGTQERNAKMISTVPEKTRRIISLLDLKEEENLSKPLHQFRSKTAGIIYANRFMGKFPSYMRKLTVECNSPRYGLQDSPVAETVVTAGRSPRSPSPAQTSPPRRTRRKLPGTSRSTPSNSPTFSPAASPERIRSSSFGSKTGPRSSSSLNKNGKRYTYVPQRLLQRGTTSPHKL